MDNATDNDPYGSSVPVRRYPLATAVAMALAGATLLGGCASDGGAVKPGQEVARAKAAFMRQDYATAARMLSEPAMKGDPEAQYALGYMYYYGQGVSKDLYRARSWLEHSASLGYADAKRALALLTTYGRLPSLPEKPGISAPATPSVPPAPVSNATLSNAETSEPAAQAPIAATPPPAGAALQCEPRPPAVAAQTPASPVVQAPSVANGQPTAQPSASAPTQDMAAEPAPSAPVATAGPVVAPVAPAPAPTSAPSPEAVAPKPESPVVSNVPPAPAPAPAPAATQPQPPSAPEGADGELEAAPVAAVDRTQVARAKPPRYTLHLLSSRNKVDLMRLAQTHGLSHAVAYYQVEQADGTHYRLIFGGFDTVAEAHAALNALPEGLFKSKPWVNNYPDQLVVMHFDAAMGRMARR